jgi:hypothetical protein
MKLPELDHAERYAGLYVFDFGDQAAVGYTAEEVAALLDSQRYADGKVYRIHRALPDGTIELAGVPTERFQLEDGLFFYRSSSDAARIDFQTLKQLAEETPPPCKAKVVLARIPGARYPNVNTLIFPAESTHEISDWLTRIGYEGGDFVEGGISQVSDFYAAEARIFEKTQLSGAPDASRPAEEVLSSTHLAIQRIPA